MGPDGARVVADRVVRRVGAAQGAHPERAEQVEAGQPPGDPFIVQLATSVKTNADAVANPLSLTPDPFTPGSLQTARRYAVCDL